MDNERRSTELQQLAVTVAQLTTLMEVNSKRRDDDMATLKEKISERNEDMRIIKHDVANILQALNALPIMNDKITDNSKAIASTLAKLEAVESWKDKNELAVASIAVHTNRIEALENWKLGIETKAGTYKSIGSAGVWFLSTFGAAIAGFIGWYLNQSGVINGE